MYNPFCAMAPLDQNQSDLCFTQYKAYLFWLNVQIIPHHIHSALFDIHHIGNSKCVSQEQVPLYRDRMLQKEHLIRPI